MSVIRSGEGKALHELKILPMFFEAVADGRKNFELRKSDRDFHVGDTVVLREWTPKSGYTGRWLLSSISYVLCEFEGLEPGYCIFGIGG